MFIMTGRVSLKICLPLWLSVRRFVIATLLFGLLGAGTSFTQSGAVIPQGGAGHAAQASCVILKRMGPADEITSHLYSFGIRGKQFQYVEGKFPDGFPFHGRLTDHDVRNLQGRGAEVVVLNQNFTADDLKQARADCRGETGSTPNQAEGQAAPSQVTKGPGSMVPAQAAAPNNSLAVASTGKLSLASVPDGADIEVDGSFVGNTPSDVQVTEGDHTVTVRKAGFKDWERTLKITAGSSVHLNADLEKIQNP
jgi:PEGA domain-containing protein